MAWANLPRRSEKSLVGAPECAISLAEIFHFYQGVTMSDMDLKAELERLKRENEELKQGKKRGGNLYLKVSQKGAVSLYGMGRFPVTLYKEQWTRMLDFGDEIREFIKSNEGQLKTKGEKDED